MKNYDYWKKSQITDISIFCYWLHQKGVGIYEGYSNASVCPSFRPSFCNILVNTLRISILQWILTKLGTYLVIRRVWNPINFQGHRVKFWLRNIPVNTRINILQWILTKLGTYLVLRRVWNRIDFQGHRSKVNVTGSNFYRVISLWAL